MATVKNSIQVSAGQIEYRPVYTAGDLAGRIAGRCVRYGLISGAQRAGYRPEWFYQTFSLQTTALNTRPLQPVKPFGDERSAGDFASVIRPTGS